MAKTCKSHEKGSNPKYSGGRVRNIWVTYLELWDSRGKLRVIPDETTMSQDNAVKGGDRKACRLLSGPYPIS